MADNETILLVTNENEVRFKGSLLRMFSVFPILIALTISNFSNAIPWTLLLAVWILVSKFSPLLSHTFKHCHVSSYDQNGLGRAEVYAVYIDSPASWYNASGVGAE